MAPPPPSPTMAPPPPSQLSVTLTATTSRVVIAMLVIQLLPLFAIYGTFLVLGAKALGRKCGFQAFSSTGDMDGLSAWEASQWSFQGKGADHGMLLAAVVLLNVALLGYANSSSHSTADANVAMAGVLMVSASLFVSWYRETYTFKKFLFVIVQAFSLVTVAASIWFKASKYGEVLEPELPPLPSLPDLPDLPASSEHFSKSSLSTVRQAAILIIVIQVVSTVCIGIDFIRLYSMQMGEVPLARSASRAASSYLVASGNPGRKAYLFCTEVELLTVRVHRVLLSCHLVDTKSGLNPLLVGFFERNRDMVLVNSGLRGYMCIFYLLWHSFISLIIALLPVSDLTLETSIFSTFITVVLYGSMSAYFAGLFHYQCTRCILPSALKGKNGLKDACTKLALRMQNDFSRMLDTTESGEVILQYYASLRQEDLPMTLLKVAPTTVQDALESCSHDITLATLLTRARQYFEGTSGREDRFCKIELNRFLAWYGTCLGILEKVLEGQS